MSVSRKTAYAALTLLIFCAALEGVSRIIWWRLEARATQIHLRRGQAVLRNDAINFMKVPDRVYGYRLKEGYQHPGGGESINRQGFHQTGDVAITKTPGVLRIACLGESTTYGTDVGNNYPALLARILRENAQGYRGYEVINAGVPGWVSGQIALRVRRQVAEYRPDAAVLYIGWNDFQSADPMAPPPSMPAFETTYGGMTWKYFAADRVKTVALASAFYDFWMRRRAKNLPPPPAIHSPELQYRFLLQSLDDIVTQLRRANPNVRIYVCTLVALWPQGTDEQWKQMSSIWWATERGLSPVQIAQLVEEMNGQLRNFARTRGLALVDTASAFTDLDRLRIQVDFAHMNQDGYELLAWKLYDAFRETGLVRGQNGARESELLAAYRLPAATH